MSPPKKVHYKKPRYKIPETRQEILMAIAYAYTCGISGHCSDGWDIEDYMLAQRILLSLGGERLGDSPSIVKNKFINFRKKGIAPSVINQNLRRGKGSRS